MSYKYRFALLILLAASTVKGVQLRNLGRDYRAGEDETDFIFETSNNAVGSRRLQMDEDSVGAVTIKNTYIIGEGSDGVKVACDSSYCNTTSLLAGGSFYVKMTDIDGSNDFSAFDAISLEETSQGGCGSARSNPVGKYSTGESIVAKYRNIVSSQELTESGLPHTTSSPLTTPGRIHCYKRSAGDTTSCFFGCQNDDCGDTTELADTEGVAVTRPGYYNLCTCLNGLNGATCANGNAADFDVDLGVVVQVHGFSQASYNADDICSSSIKKCVYGYPCALNYEVTGYDDTASVAVSDSTSGIGIRYDSIDPAQAVGIDSIAIMNTTTPCSKEGHIIQVQGSNKLIAQAAYYNSTHEDSALGETVRFDFSAAGGIDTAPGDYRACYCPGSIYGSELTNGLDCSSGAAEYYPFKAGKVTVRGPYADTLGATNCLIGTECEIVMTEQNGKCLQTNDTIAIVGTGTDTSFGCGDSSIPIQGITTNNKLNDLNFTNPALSSSEGVFSWMLEKGIGLQGEYNLCWCHNEFENCFKESATSEDFRVKIGNLTIPGALANNPKSCYTGRSCTLKFPSSDSNKNCFGCEAGDLLKISEAKVESISGTTLSFYNSSTAFCGQIDTDILTYSNSFEGAEAPVDADTESRFNYTINAVNVQPSLDESSVTHSLCWASVNTPSDYNALVTLSQDITIYGPRADNYVSCSGNGTDCAGIQLAVVRHASLIGGDNEDAVLVQPSSQECGAGEVKLNTSEASNLYTFDNQLLPADAANGDELLIPGEYRMCYCPHQIMTDTGIGEESISIDCSDTSEYKSDVGIFVVAGPASSMATAGDGIYKAFKGIPLDLTLFGYELGAGHKLKFVNSTQDCGVDTFDESIDNYISDGTAPSYLTSLDVLDSTTVVAATPVNEFLATLEVATTLGLSAGDKIKFTTSSGVVMNGVNTHTRSDTELFRIHQTHNNTPRKNWAYTVTDVLNSTHFNIEYPNMPEVTNIGSNEFRLSNAEVYPTIMASETGDFKICWAGSNFDYFHAATLRVAEPLTMPSASIYLTSRVYMKSGASLVLFKTGSSSSVSHLTTAAGTESVKSIYEDPERSMKLVLRFKDTTKFKPLIASHGSSSSLITDSSFNSEDEGDTKYCSKMFFELYSKIGFPMPEKCWYIKNSTGKTVDLYLAFQRGNGLKADTEYELVLNTMLGSDATENDILLDIFIMDDAISKPNTVIEFKQVNYVSNGYNITANNEDGGNQLSSTGLKVTSDNSTNSLFNVTDPSAESSIFKLSLTGGSKKPVIGDKIELFMYPLTLWDLEQTEISLNSLTGYQYTSNATITTEALVPGGRKNMLVVQVADNFTSTHEIEIDARALSYPEDGFFALVPFYSAQLLTGGSKNAAADVGLTDFTNSHLFIHKPSLGEATLVSDVTTGVNNYQDKKNEENILNLHLITGSAIYFNGNSGDTHIKVTLPKPNGNSAYTCKNSNSAITVGSTVTELSVIKYSDEDNSVLRKAPRNSGTLDGQFSGSSNICTLKLEDGVMVPRKTSLYLRLKVENPNKPLKTSNPDNKWTVAITQGKGQFSKSINTETVEKIVQSSLIVDKRYSKNVGVTGIIQPEHVSIRSTISDVIGDYTRLSMFFKAEQSTATSSSSTLSTGGSLAITAPAGYRFLNSDGSIVSAASLISVADPDNKKMFAPEIIGVKTVLLDAESKREVLIISFAKPIKADTFYGVSFPVKNPVEYDSTTMNDWDVATYEGSCSFSGAHLASKDNCYTLDRQTNGDLKETTKLFDQNMSSFFDYYLLNPVPNSGTPTKGIFKFKPDGKLRESQVFSIELPFNVKFTDPAIESNVTQYITNDTLSFYDKTQIDWEPNSVAVTNNRMLSFKELDKQFNNTNGNEAYYLAANILVPDRSSAFDSIPTPNVLRVSAGELEMSNKTASRIIFPGMYSSQVENLVITPSNQNNGTENYLEVGFQTFTEVNSTSCLALYFPQSSMHFASGSACTLKIASDDFYDSRLPTIMPECSFLVDNTTDIQSVKELRITPSAENSLDAGKYKLGFYVVNPVEPYTASSSDLFILESYKNCSSESITDNNNLLDKQASVMAFSLYAPLTSAEFIASPTNITEDYKPGVVSPYTIAFEYGEGATMGAELKLIAPQGYEFNADCTADVNVTSAGGSGANATMIQETYYPLGVNVTVDKCESDINMSNQATITFTDATYSNLETERPYFFSFNVTNALNRPNENKWTLETGGQSLSFEGKPLDFIYPLELTPTSTAKGANSTLIFSMELASTLTGVGSTLFIRVPGVFKHTSLVSSAATSLCEQTSFVVSGTSYSVASGFAESLSQAKNMTSFGAGEVGCLSSTKSGDLLYAFIINTSTLTINPTDILEVSFAVQNPTESYIGVPPEVQLWTCTATVDDELCQVHQKADFIRSAYSVNYGTVGVYRVADPLILSPLVASSVTGKAPTEVTITFAVTMFDRMEGDKVIVTPPLDFASSVCASLTTETSMNLDSSASCVTNTDITHIVYNVMKPINSTTIEANFEIILKYTNPAYLSTAPNSWTVSYVAKTDYDVSKINQLEASALSSVAGYNILPLLENVYVKLTSNSDISVGASNEITLMFTSVQNADFVKITTVNGFDFTQATAPYGNSTNVISGGSLNTATLTLPIMAGTPVEITITGLTNPTTVVQPATSWDFTTGTTSQPALDRYTGLAGFPVVPLLSAVLKEADAETALYGATDFAVTLTFQSSLNKADEIYIKPAAGYQINTASETLTQLNTFSKLALDMNGAALNSGRDVDFVLSTPPAPSTSNDGTNFLIILASSNATVSTPPLFNEITSEILAFAAIEKDTLGALLGKLIVSNFSGSNLVPATTDAVYTATLTISDSVPLAESDILTASITAPEGYIFAADCLPQVVTTQTGNETETDTITNNDQFFTVCKGISNKADLSIPKSTAVLPPTSIDIAVSATNPRSIENKAMWSFTLSQNGTEIQKAFAEALKLSSLQASVAFQPTGNESDILFKFSPTSDVVNGTVNLIASNGYSLTNPVPETITKLGTNAVYNSSASLIYGVSLTGGVMYDLVFRTSGAENGADWGIELLDSEGMLIEAKYDISFPHQKLSDSTMKIDSVDVGFFKTEKRIQVTLDVVTSIEAPIDLEVLLPEDAFVLDQTTCMAKIVGATDITETNATDTTETNATDTTETNADTDTTDTSIHTCEKNVVKFKMTKTLTVGQHMFEFIASTFNVSPVSTYDAVYVTLSTTPKAAFGVVYKTNALPTSALDSSPTAGGSSSFALPKFTNFYSLFSMVLITLVTVFVL